VKMRKPSRRKKAAVSRGSPEPSRPGAFAALKIFHRLALHSLADLAGEIRGPLNSLQTVNHSLLETSLAPRRENFLLCCLGLSGIEFKPLKGPSLR